LVKLQETAGTVEKAIFHRIAAGKLGKTSGIFGRFWPFYSFWGEKGRTLAVGREHIVLLTKKDRKKIGVKFKKRL
jgi:hypothetical protein